MSWFHFSKKFFPFGGGLFSFFNSESLLSMLFRMLCTTRALRQESVAGATLPRSLPIVRAQSAVDTQLTLAQYSAL